MTKVIADHWDILSPPVEDDSTVDWNYIEIRDRQASGSTIDSKINRFEFEMNDMDAYVLPAKSYLFVQLEVGKSSDDSVFGSPIALQNGAPLFNKFEYLINGKPIELVEEGHLSMLVRNLLEYSDDYSRGGATSQGWFKDTATGAADNNKYTNSPNVLTGTVALAVTNDTFAGSGGTTRVPVLQITGATPGTGKDLLAGGTGVTLNAAFNDNGAYNLGYAARATLTRDAAGANKRQISLRIPLERYFGFCKMNKVSIGVRHNIRFTKASDQIALHTATNPAGAATTGKIIYKNIAWWVPYVKPSLATSLILEKQLADGAQAVMSFERTNVFFRKFDRTTRMIWNVNTEVERINKVVVFFQTEAQVTASQQQNNAIFEHFLVTQCHVKVGSMRYPDQDFMPNFTDNEDDYVRVFNEYLRCSDKVMDYDSGVPVSYSDFKTLYPMFTFDLRHQSENLFNQGNPVDLRIQFDFKQKQKDRTGADTDFYAYCVVFSDRQVKLDLVNRKTFFEVV